MYYYSIPGLVSYKQCRSIRMHTTPHFQLSSDEIQPWINFSDRKRTDAPNIIEQRRGLHPVENRLQLRIQLLSYLIRPSCIHIEYLSGVFCGIFFNTCYARVHQANT